MPTGRFALLMLPQVWVAYAYVTFQDAVGGVLPATVSTIELGLLADVVLIVTAGVGAFAVNGLVAAYLLNRVATAAPPSRARSGGSRPAGAVGRPWGRHRPIRPVARSIEPRRRPDGDRGS